MLLSVLKKHWPLWTVLIGLYASVIIIFQLSTSNQDGHLIYALDDPYIHMSIAKNLVQHGTWGVTADEFADATSSPEWVILLTGIYAVVGPNELTPLILNIIFATLLLAVIYTLLRDRKMPPLVNFLVLSCIFGLMSLIYFVFTGHEHILHALLTISFVFLASQALSLDTNLPSGLMIKLGLLTFFLAMIRYEGLFVIAIVSLLCLLRRRWFMAGLLIVAAGVPLAVHGIIAIENGGFWLPNSLIVKSDAGAHFDVIQFFTDKFHLSELYNMYRFRYFAHQNFHITQLMLIALTIAIWRGFQGRATWDQSQLMLLIFSAASFTHIWMIKPIAWYRYEGYLVVLGLFVIAFALAENIPENLTKNITKRSSTRFTAGTVMLGAATFVWLYLIGYAVFYGGFQQNNKLLRSMENIYAQQYQMATFVHEYYDGECIILNDIGAVTYLNDIQLVDIWGLGSNELADLIHTGNHDPAPVNRLIAQKNCRIAIIYTRGYENTWGSIPDAWTRIGNWTTPVVSAAYSTVTFYALDPAGVDYLTTSLQQFSPRLPDIVYESGSYVKP